MANHPHANVDEGMLCMKLRERLFEVERIAGEENFFDRPDTLRRFLKARNYDLNESEKMLKAAIEWRRKNDAIHMDCQWCHQNPGYHSIRQVGFDIQGRPVIYACFTQTANIPTVEDTVAHCTYLIENAQKTMVEPISTWVFILDCRGMTLQACNPKIGYGLTQVFANFYPERLGLVICLHHNPIFQGVWNAIKVFLPENTVAKMHLVRPKKKILEEFKKNFNKELQDWLITEMAENKKKPLPLSQRTFWKATENTNGNDVKVTKNNLKSGSTDLHQPSGHDPRGCASYIRKYIDNFKENYEKDSEGTHKPHPNIVDQLSGTIMPLRFDTPKHSPLSNHLSLKREEATSSALKESRSGYEEDSDSDETAQKMEMLEIDEQYQIPKNSVKIE